MNETQRRGQQQNEHDDRKLAPDQPDQRGQELRGRSRILRHYSSSRPRLVDLEHGKSVTNATIRLSRGFPSARSGLVTVAPAQTAALRSLTVILGRTFGDALLPIGPFDRSHGHVS